MSEKNPLLHILVIGFHHKKGCQVEFSYPPIVTGTGGGNECPTGWKYLPTLALPDGSHNFEEDSVFFNLPSLDDPNETIYGVSCYRQIPVEKLKIRTADVTRSTVQKSVCALISLPIYGYIEVKLSLIAHAFFDQGDFETTKLLIDAYNQLNACLLSNGQILSSPLKQIYVGLNLRDILLKWRNKTLILFKLFLLQKRIVCFGSPVRPMCALILGISSLHPSLLEQGFRQVACVRTSRPMSPMPNFVEQNDTEKDEAEEKHDHDNLDNIDETQSNKIKVKNSGHKNSNTSPNGMELGKRSEKNSLPRDASVDALASASLAPLCAVKPSAWNAPLPLFQHGNLCLPYLSLPYMDLLSDSSVLGYTIGTSNILFQQKKQLADVLIDIEAAIMETHDQDLRRQLQLTTEDLRFIDFIIRQVTNPKEGAEGSELWIREQFQGYMISMIKSSLFPETAKEYEHFNSHFMSAWKKTACYQEWYEKKPDDAIFESIPSGHPFAGNLSVADMKIRIAQTMHNTESGRKINQAVNTTSKAVGGALSQAKGAFSNWWSSITTTTNSPNSTHSQSSIDEEPIIICSKEDNGENGELKEKSNDEDANHDDNDQSINLIKDNKIKNVEKEICSNIKNETILDNDKSIELAEEAGTYDSNRQILAV